MDFLDPRLAVLSLAVAVVASEHVRKGIGRGIGYVAAGTMKVGGSVVGAGRDIVEEAREVAAHNGAPSSHAARPATRRSKSAAAA